MFAAMKSVPAGYSGKPLSAKLGLKQGMRAAFINAPEHLAGLLDDVWFDSCVPALAAGTQLWATTPKHFAAIHTAVGKVLFKILSQCLCAVGLDSDVPRTVILNA